MSCPLCHQNAAEHLGEKNGHVLVRCGNCTFIHVDPMPSASQLHSLYEGFRQTRQYVKKIEKKRLTSRYKLKKLRRYLDTKSPIDFLDVGCSVGATCAAAMDLGWHTTGIDLDQPALTIARERFPKGEFLATSLQSLIDAERKFDVVYCAEVLEHVPDPHAFVEELKSVLAQNGILFLTTPDAGHRSVPRKFTEWKRVTPPEHIGYFSQNTTDRLFREHGLRPIKFLWSHRSALRVIARRHPV